MEHLLAALRAVAEPTRLRLGVLCARGELTVSELTQILGQSQPRVSRHLKLLCEAGLLDRFRGGSWVFYRLSQSSPAAARGRGSRVGGGGRAARPLRPSLWMCRGWARSSASAPTSRAPIPAKMPRNGTASAR